MGWCHEFGPQITAGCDHPMVAGPDACTCEVCGTRCTGRFSACAAVWAKGPGPPAGITPAGGHRHEPLEGPAGLQADGSRTTSTSEEPSVAMIEIADGAWSTNTGEAGGDSAPVDRATIPTEPPSADLAHRELLDWFGEAERQLADALDRSRVEAMEVRLAAHRAFSEALGRADALLADAEAKVPVNGCPSPPKAAMEEVTHRLRQDLRRLLSRSRGEPSSAAAEGRPPGGAGGGQR